MTLKKKLIEVAMPLEAINRESAREKSIRHSHPSTLHLWWARRPLAACRAVIFASLVDDPSSHPDLFPTEDEQESERRRLFSLIEELVQWDNSRDATLFARAHAEITKHCDDVPAIVDPFCGGGSIPLEAQRLGLASLASDLNPVPTVITMALVQIPARFRGLPAISTSERPVLEGASWRGAAGLAEDVRFYGAWVRDQARERIGYLYPDFSTSASGGGAAPIIAWLWARTVPCPNPACGAAMPLARSFSLSTRPGNAAWVEPRVNHATKSVEFEVRNEGQPPESVKVGRGASFRCIVCSHIAQEESVRAAFKDGRAGRQLMAAVVQDGRRRLYLSPSQVPPIDESAVTPAWEPQAEMNQKTSNLVSGRGYGISRWSQLFTKRQLVALTTFVDLVQESHGRILIDAARAGLKDDDHPLIEGGSGARAYADAVCTYLAFAVDKNTLTNSTQATWQTNPDRLTQAYARQALPMTWDYAEANPLSDAGGGFILTLESLAEVLEAVPAWGPEGIVRQLDARAVTVDAPKAVFVTDPPYYDNIGYADLADYFYIWMRETLNKIYPQLFSTLLTPKEQELVAASHRFDGDRKKAERFFEEGLGVAFGAVARQQTVEYPIAIFYAFKQSESEQDGAGAGVQVSTGWETMLEALAKAGLAITGTWPMRTELTGNLKKNVGALASSIVLICRPRPVDAPIATRKEFVTRLRSELPSALKVMQHGAIAPVDLAQAAIGPGMSVFSGYSKVIEADGAAMSIRTALALINQALDAVLIEQEGEYDASTRWAVAWFEQHGLNPGRFGDAETLSKAKNTSLKGLVEDGLLAVQGSAVRLLAREELPADWDPRLDRRLTVWEACQYLVRGLEQAGEQGAANLLRSIGPDFGERAKDLSYRLYSTCERKKWLREAVAYNALVAAWPEISRIANSRPTEQLSAFE